MARGAQDPKLLPLIHSVIISIYILIFGFLS
jgi:hypothetical protein